MLRGGEEKAKSGGKGCRNLEETWKIIEQDLHGSGAKLIMRLLEVEPTALQFFPFKHANNVSADDEEVRGHGRLIIQMFGRAVRNQNNLARLDPELKAVGKMHEKLHMDGSLFAKAGDALLWLLKTEWAQKRWDQEGKAWEDLVGFVVKGLAGGMRKASDPVALANS
eukprot:135399-Rhodomonas_salina.1